MGTPLFLNKKESVLLAIVTPDAERQFIAVRDDLHPFTFTDEERTAIEKRLAAVRAKPKRV